MFQLEILKNSVSRYATERGRLLIADRCRGAVELRDIDRKRFVVRPRPFAQNVQCDLLAKQYRPIGGTPKVNARMNSVPERNIESEFAQFTIHCQRRARIRHERQTV